MRCASSGNSWRPRLRELISVSAASIVALAMASGCGMAYERKYRNAIEENQKGLTQLKVGMDSAETERIMGVGKIVKYKKIHLDDPYKSEEFQRKNGERVVVRYYITQHPRAWDDVKDSDLTPLVFSDGRLTGWGWIHLRSMAQ